MAHTATDLDQAAADLTRAFNDAGWDRFRSGLAPNVVYSETGTGRRVEGADAYLALYKGWKEALPDGSGTIRKSLAVSEFAPRPKPPEDRPQGVISLRLEPVQKMPLGRAS